MSIFCTVSRHNPLQTNPPSLKFADPGQNPLRVFEEPDNIPFMSNTYFKIKLL